MHHVEIDEGSGFCFGVTTAIRKAEEELAKGEPLYCLGDIVHNGQECERLKQLGLITINHDEFARLKNAKVLLRAHGEPPQTYETARLNNIEIIDATCPVVLRLQKRIKQEERTCRSAGRRGTDQRKSHCHRETGRSDPARFHQGHPSVLTDHQVTGRIPPDCVIHRSTHCPAGQLPVFRHHLPPGGQPHAQHPGIRRFPRPGVLCLRTQELQRKDTFPGMPQGQPEYVAD